jgi:tRNA pseudouridine55 synthase
MNKVLILDKPGGLSSQQAVTKVKRALGVKKAGHAGTLDPMATGVLLVCLGEATKVSRFLMDLGKEYLATVKLGQATDTLDAEGEVTESVEGVVPLVEEVQEALVKFRGDIFQLPPMYSALKQNGTPLYKLARQGIEVERKTRPVTIHSLTLEAYEFPYLTIRLSCTKGTYVRTLADDLGRALGTVAHMTALRRTAVGSLRIENGVSFDELSSNTNGLLDIEQALSNLTSIILNEKDFQFMSNGRPVAADPYNSLIEKEPLFLKSPLGIPFAVGELKGKMLRIIRILHLGAESLNQ